MDIDPTDEDFGTHWLVKQSGEKIEKIKSLGMSTQMGFGLIKMPKNLVIIEWE